MFRHFATLHLSLHHARRARKKVLESSEECFFRLLNLFSRLTFGKKKSVQISCTRATFVLDVTNQRRVFCGEKS